MAKQRKELVVGKNFDLPELAQLFNKGVSVGFFMGKLLAAKQNNKDEFDKYNAVIAKQSLE